MLFYFRNSIKLKKVFKFENKIKSLEQFINAKIFSGTYMRNLWYRRLTNQNTVNVKEQQKRNRSHRSSIHSRRIKQLPAD